MDKVTPRRYTQTITIDVENPYVDTYNIDPCPKPRMTRKDKFFPRKCTAKYWEFKRQVRADKIEIQEHGANIIFHVPMPKSWSRKKKDKMVTKPHQQTPDVDNYLKAILDAVYDNDCKVWDIRATKLWSELGMIEIRKGY